MAIKFLNGLTVTGASTFSSALTLSTIANASSDTDKFLVSDSGVIKYRTGAEVRSDIGAGTGDGTVTSANGVNNRVATFSSATALNGESALTFDGTTLETTGTMECTKFVANAAGGFEFDIEGANHFNMRHTVADKSMYFVTAAGEGTINFGTNNTNSRVTITDTGALKSTISLSVGNLTPSTTTGRIDASNDVVAYSTSDIRLKNNIKTIDKALDKVKSIQGIEFDWIEKEKVHGNSGHDVGVIAQEIEKVLPDVVTTRDSGYKAVKYEKIVPLLIEAIKELSRQVDGLKRLI